MTTRAFLTAPSAPRHPPPHRASSGRYEVRFAHTDEELDQILRLRFRVFNLELHEGLEESAISGRDEDEFDRRFHHLLIAERTTGEVVGTYRMQTAEMAAGYGYYSAALFGVESLPESVLASAVEIGRACVARPHRNGRVLHLLWRGLASYLTWSRKTMLFGCCSLTTQDESLGARTHDHLVQAGRVHPQYRVDPREGHRCTGPGPHGILSYPAPHIPALFAAYLKIGAKALGPPAIDREFKTIDWLVLLDSAELPTLVHRSMFS